VLNNLNEWFAGSKKQKGQQMSWPKEREQTKVPEKFVNSVDSHLTAEVQHGSSAMGDTA